MEEITITVYPRHVQRRRWTSEERRDYLRSMARIKREDGRKRYIRAYLNRARQIARKKGLEVIG